MEIVTNNNLIKYSLIGPSSSRELSIIFLHGWRSQKEIWNPVVSNLHAKPYTLDANVYALDLPGFGQSPAPRDVWGVGDYAEIVKDFIEKLELKNVILVGHSFGGRVGIKLAAEHPNIVFKLVLVDAAGFSMASSKKNAMGMAAKIAKPFFKPKFMQGLRKKIYQTIGAEDYLATPELQETFKNIVNEDLTEDMKKVTCPTLIVWGDRDTETPVEFGQKMHELVPSSKFQVIKSAGHFSFLDKPEEFVKVLVDFI